LPPNLENFGRWLVVSGIFLVVIGGTLILIQRLGIKNLPGTFKFEFQGITCIIPILASVFISIVLTILLNIIGKILKP